MGIRASAELTRPGDPSLAAELRAQAARARALADFSHAVNVAVDDFDASLTLIAQRTAAVLGDTCSINLLSADRRSVESAALHVSDPEQAPVAEAFARERVQPLEEFALRDVLLSGETRFAPRLSGLLLDALLARLRGRGIPAASRPRGLIAVPLRARGGVIGVLVLVRTDPGLPAYTEADREFAEELAVRAAVAIDNARLFRQIQRVTEELALSEQRLQAIFDSAPVGISTRDLSGRLIEVNRAYARMLGFEPEELRGTRISEISDGDDPDAERRFQELLEGRRERVDVERRYIRRDGRRMEAHVTSLLVRGAGGEPRFALGIVEDVTERRRLEQQLRQSQKMEALGRLAGGVAHDFNNVLTVILAVGEVVAATLGEEHELAGELDEISRAALHGSALTRQLLAFSRNQVVEPVALELGEVTSRLSAMLARLLGDDVELLILTPEPIVVRADPHQLEQVLLNLAVNARDAMPGGGRLTIATAAVVLDADDAPLELPAGRYAVLSVSDTGTGMDAETASRAFEPFFTTKAAGAGTGLGLATVFGIVKQSGGAVSVYSEPGHGTTFRVHLPLGTGAGAAEAPAARPRPARRPAAGMTILVVEDDGGVRALIERTLRHEGYNVLVAGSAAEAMELAGDPERELHLLLTDLTLPDVSGRELALRLRRERPGLPVLYSSGYSRADVLERIPGERLAFIEKPFRRDDLVRSVADAIAPT
jgi:two-component system cell cycle sensor histidine kinase/response regulator CckA